MTQTKHQTVKEAAQQAVDSLPDQAQAEDILYALNVLARIDESEKQVSKGKPLPHEQVKKSLRKWRK